MMIYELMGLEHPMTGFCLKKIYFHSTTIAIQTSKPITHTNRKLLIFNGYRCSNGMKFV